MGYQCHTWQHNIPYNYTTCFWRTAYFLFLKFHLSIYLVDRKTGRDKKIFHGLGYSQNTCNSLGRDRNSIRILHDGRQEPKILGHHLQAARCISRMLRVETGLDSRHSEWQDDVLWQHLHPFSLQLEFLCSFLAGHWLTYHNYLRVLSKQALLFLRILRMC